MGATLSPVPSTVTVLGLVSSVRPLNSATVPFTEMRLPTATPAGMVALFTYTKRPSEVAGLPSPVGSCR